MSFNIVTNKNFSGNWLNTTNSNSSECNINQWFNVTDGFTKLNGKVPDGILSQAPPKSSEIKLDVVNILGQRNTVVRAVIKPGFRSPIHIHPCCDSTGTVIKGELTIMHEGFETRTYGPETAFYMYNCRPMVAANLGTEDVVIINNWVGPRGEAYQINIEPDWKGPRVLRWKK